MNTTEKTVSTAVPSMPPDVLSRGDEFTRIGNIAVQKAQAESRRLGVPNVYFINGEPWYELPSGELSREDPWRGQLTPPSPTSPEPPS